MSEEYDNPSQTVVTNHDNAISERPASIDPAKFTMTVAEALIEFLNQGCSTTERTIQRYCQNGKLQALRVDPDSRQVTDKDPYLFLIDPTSVAKRISIAKEQQEFSRPTIVTTRHEQSRQGAALSDTVASKSDVVEQPTEAQAEKLAELESENQSLKIDKAVRDKMVEQLKEDRSRLFAQMEQYVEKITQQSRQLGSLETQLQLNASEPETPNDEKSQTAKIAAPTYAPEMNRRETTDDQFGV